MNDNPTTIPSVPLKIITASLVMLLVVLPVLAVVKSGQVGSIPTVIAGGLTFAVITLGLMFLHRIILWIHYRFYWYVTAVLFAILFMIGLIFVVNMTSSTQIAVLNTTPAWVVTIFIPGAIIGIIAIVLVFRRGRSPTPAQVKPVSPSPVAPLPPAPREKQILDTAQQIAARKKDLGLDDK